MLIDRRSLILAATSIPSLISSLHAQDVPGSASTANVPPELDGRADFAHAWSRTDQGEIIAAEPPPELPDGIAEEFANTIFYSAKDIDDHFTGITEKAFVDWFNSKVADQAYFKGKRIGAKGAQENLIKENFKNFWNSYLSEGNGISLTEFLAYMSIFIAERDGNLISAAEEINPDNPRWEHPGIAYLFDTVVFNKGGKKWRKKSFNQSPNWQCGRLFNNAEFDKKNLRLALRPTLNRTHDQVWNGTRYPKESVSCSADPATTGYILECDFYKFRGRGVIQTTWRENYKALIKFVQDYSGNDPTLQTYSSSWKKIAVDDICTISSNDDWDELFGRSEILCEAIRTHARAGEYLPLSDRTKTLNSAGPGSLIRMGIRIGGGGYYGGILKARVYQLSISLRRR